VEKAPAVGSAALPEITMMPGRVGNGKSAETSRLPQPTIPAKPLKVAAKKGQTSSFVMPTRTLPRHFLYDAEPGAVENGHRSRSPNAVLKQIDDFGLYGTDVDTPQELARFEVIQEYRHRSRLPVHCAPRRHGGSCGKAPAVGSAALPEITIDAGPGRKWKSGGNESTPATPTIPAKPLKVAAKKGQTLVFRHADPNLSHGIFFTTPSLVLLKTDTKPKPNAVLKQIDDFGLYGTDVDTPQELARFEVIQDIATAPAFQCTVHLADMAGVVEKAPAVGSALFRRSR